MKFIFRKNQMIISALAVMLAIAGYLTYATDEEAWDQSALTAQMGDTVFELSDEDLLAENQNAQPKESMTNGEAAELTNGDIVSLDQDITDLNTTPGEAVLTSGMTIADYMAQSKLDREQTRGMTKEMLLEIINNDNLAAEEKQTAIDSMVALNSIAEKENAAETLLKSKGFSNAIVSIQTDQVDVVIGKESLTDAEVAQIEDIIKRKTEMTVEQIVISLVNMGEK